MWGPGIGVVALCEASVAIALVLLEPGDFSRALAVKPA
jgi:hypothetical protein